MFALGAQQEYVVFGCVTDCTGIRRVIYGVGSRRVGLAMAVAVADGCGAALIEGQRP